MQKEIVNLTFTLPKELKEQISVFAKANDLTVSGLLRRGARRIISTQKESDL